MDVIPPFANHLPVRIRFGAGSVALLGEVLRDGEASRPFVVIDEHVQELPPIVAALAGAGGEAGRFQKGAGEPTVEDVEAAAAALAASGADSVIAIGGGSVMDTAKAARLVAGQGGPYLRFTAGDATFEPPRIPLVTIPTTAGTGSEVSGAAVITDEQAGTKAGIAHPLMRAQHALVDPELTHGLPRAPTLYAGIDALAQLVAAMVVTVRTPIGNGIALEGIRLAADALPAVVSDGSNREARSRMSCASLLGGLAMNISDCGSEHSIAQAIGGRFHVPHGLTIGLVLAETIEHDRPGAVEQLERIADALGEPGGGAADGSRAVRAIRRILRELDFPTLASIGVREEHLPALADAARGDFFISLAPVPWTVADIVACYRTALALETR